MDVLTWAKGVWAAIKGAGDAGRALEIADLQDRLDEERERRRDAEAEVLELREEMEARARRDAIEDELEFDDGVYWRFLDEDGREGPFCQRCWARDDQLNPMQDNRDGSLGCGVCDYITRHDEATGGGPPVNLGGI